ncbi:acetyltransferase (GNAT) family protein [Ureibacillus xyleni]|uniref:Lipid II:glycine glycyltransferase n=1 Tax=Ureibacillus xyleni TaxID=614648 RepID=A0A285RHJ3_9BACL|nr:GNAT family N-acetyltransferase [Ureibacillus xyleni]SOB93573.1 acetyltransferase (GNAT) family protein [Ureibacillus xyleni]
MLSIFKINEKEKWNEIVKNFNHYDIYYLSNYVEAFQLHGDGEPLLFYFEHNKMKAINVVMKRDISKDKRFTEKIPSNTYFDFSTPYGFGGFILEGNITEENINMLDNEYTSFCQKNGIISEIVRFHPIHNHTDVLQNIYDISTLGKTVTIDVESIEQMRKNLADSNKYKIKKSKKSGVKIYWGWNQDLLDEFMTLYNDTMTNNNATNYYYFEKDFYENILQELKYQAMIFYAEYEKKKIAMAIILYSKDHIHYHFSALDRDYSHLRPMNLLIYEVMCWGNENGFKTFHLGGGLGSKEDSLYEFKRSFNRNSSTVFKLGKKIFSKENYDLLLKIRCEQIEENRKDNFFPEYRA